MNEIIIRNKEYKHLLRQMLPVIDITSWASIYLIPFLFFISFFIVKRFNFGDFTIVWLITSGIFFLLSLSTLTYDEISYCKIDNNFIRIKPVFNFLIKKIPIAKINELSIYHYPEYTSIGIDYEKKKDKTEFISFRAENYEVIKNWALANKIPLSIWYS